MVKHDARLPARQHSQADDILGILLFSEHEEEPGHSSPAVTQVDAGGNVGTRTLVRGLAILDCFGPHAPHLTLQRISQMTGLPKATAFRLVHTLESRGWLVHNKLQEYSLSSKFSAAPAVTTPSILELARPVMRDLAENSGHGVTLHTLAGGRRVFLDAVASASMLRAIHYSSHPVPLCLGGATLVLLASMPPLELQALLPAAAESANCPPQELLSIVETTRRQGYAVSHGGGAEGITGIAAPVLAGKHAGVICITIVLPTPAAKGRVSELVALARDAAARLSNRLATA